MKLNGFRAKCKGKFLAAKKNIKAFGTAVVAFTLACVGTVINFFSTVNAGAHAVAERVNDVACSKMMACIDTLGINTVLNPDTCPDYIKNSHLGRQAIALLDYTSFLQSGVKALKVVIIAVGGGLAVLGVVNLLEGYGNENPGAKSQGMKQFMAGAGVMLIGALLVPKLSDLIPSTL